MYKVIRAFADAYDGERVYNVGDTYPARGVNVGSKRIEELSSSHNARGVAFIACDVPEKGSREPERTLEETRAGVSAPAQTKSKRRPRKGQEERA